MKIKKQLIKRKLAQDSVLVPVGKTIYDSNGLFILNGAGAFLWDHLEAAESEAELLALLLEEYETTEEVAGQDLHEFLDKLRDMGILE